MSSWDVEIWHDTTMWNEGFEHARQPFVTLVAPTEEVAAAVSSWVDTSYSLQTRTWEDIDKAFTTRTHPTGPRDSDAHPVVNLTHAQTVVPALLAQWRGI